MMDNNEIKLMPYIAWLLLGVLFGFVTTTMSDIINIPLCFHPLIAGLVATGATVILLKFQKSSKDRVVVGLCAIILATIASYVKYTATDTIAPSNISILIIGILTGITVSIAFAAYVIQEE